MRCENCGHSEYYHDHERECYYGKCICAKYILTKQEKDVHTEHCCKRCGCKYGSKDCSVVSGKKRQSLKCGDAWCWDSSNAKDKIVIIYTTFDGVSVLNYTIGKFLDEIDDGEFDEIEWVEKVKDFDWERANNGMVFNSQCVTPEQL